MNWKPNLEAMEGTITIEHMSSNRLPVVRVERQKERDREMLVDRATDEFQNRSTRSPNP